MEFKNGIRNDFQNDIREGFGRGQFDYGDHMSVTASHCSKFSRRHDFSAFSMTDYQSCENCRHLTADSICIVKTGGRMDVWT